MDYLLKTGNLAKIRTSCLVVGVFAKGQLSEPAVSLDESSGGMLTRVLEKGDFDGTAGQHQFIYDLAGCSCARVMLIGLGPREEFDLPAYRKAAEKTASILNESHAADAVTSLSALDPKEASGYQVLRATVLASAGALYRFQQCKSKVEPLKRPLKRLGLHIGKRRKSVLLERALRHGQAIANGVSLAKDLGNLPGNICTPGYLASKAKGLGRKSKKLNVRVLGEKEMQTLGMGALLSVSRGSRQPAKLIVMEYRGGPSKAAPLVLIGKGLTFDAGGISIKPAAGMDEMKYDMCGGASIFGAMAACLELELPLNLVGIVPSSENLPDGAASKPGDIVTSMSGQTIEVLNTDAEGRLILCDSLTYAERYSPAAVIDVATLTGACVVALGAHASGLLSNDDSLAEEVLSAGISSCDRAWRLPLWDDYQSQLDSNFADMANVGGKSAGTITAACFLSRFAKKFRWAHLDIAGSAWSSAPDKWSTGRPVPLLAQLLLKRCGLDG